MSQPTKIDHLECTVPVRGGASSWVLKTTRKLSAVTPEYLLSFEDRPLMRHDRIEVTASMNETKAEYCTLVVSAVNEKGKVTALEMLP